MKIAFTGAQSTGKTTVMNELQAYYPYTPDFKFLSEITRDVAKLNLKINEDGNDQTQLLIMNKHLENVQKQNIVMDRCALDGVVYTRYLYNRGQVSEWVMDYAERVFSLMIDRYDFIFYIAPEFAITDDGVRSTSVDFRNEIVKLFEQYILLCEIPVTHLTGDKQERVSKVRTTIGVY
ncbi:ATP-binding protein [bacterium]|nr:ATP-binding protein [bacterium]